MYEWVWESKNIVKRRSLYPEQKGTKARAFPGGGYSSNGQDVWLLGVAFHNVSNHGGHGKVGTHSANSQSKRKHAHCFARVSSQLQIKHGGKNVGNETSGGTPSQVENVVEGRSQNGQNGHNGPNENCETKMKRRDELFLFQQPPIELWALGFGRWAVQSLEWRRRWHGRGCRGRGGWNAENEHFTAGKEWQRQRKDDKATHKKLGNVDLDAIGVKLQHDACGGSPKRKVHCEAHADTQKDANADGQGGNHPKVPHVPDVGTETLVPKMHTMVPNKEKHKGANTVEKESNNTNCGVRSFAQENRQAGKVAPTLSPCKDAWVDVDPIGCKRCPLQGNVGSGMGKVHVNDDAGDAKNGAQLENRRLSHNRHVPCCHQRKNDNETDKERHQVITLEKVEELVVVSHDSSKCRREVVLDDLGVDHEGKERVGELGDKDQNSSNPTTSNGSELLIGSIDSLRVQRESDEQIVRSLVEHRNQ